MIAEIIPEHRWTKNGQKFYTARVSRDMFGWWSVLCCWGSLRSRLGNTKIYAFKSHSEACLFLQGIAKKRKWRGYTPDDVDQTDTNSVTTQRPEPPLPPARAVPSLNPPAPAPPHPVFAAAEAAVPATL